MFAKKRPLVAASCLVWGALAGCTFQTGDFTILAAKETGLRMTKLVDDANGESCATRVLGVIPLGKGAASVGEAVEMALATKPDANVMTDIDVDVRVTPYLVANKSCVRVEGDLEVIR